jgi:uncharacterized coiled-coil DUF342 family protein
MSMSDLHLKAQEYKQKLDVLVGERQEVERQLIILDEQYKQYKRQIEEAFNTSDPDELLKIAEGYIQNITNLEKQLQDGTDDV